MIEALSFMGIFGTIIVLPLFVGGLILEIIIPAIIKRKHR